MIYSIGYIKITPEQLEQTIREHNIDLLIDVRSVPSSRKAGFNRKKLEQRFGLEVYVWKGDILGGKFGPALDIGIDYLLQLDKEGKQILMCVENDPRDCHRYQDIGVRLLEHGIDVVHLYDGKAETTSEILKGR